jgi:hypothetical protein
MKLLLIAVLACLSVACASVPLRAGQTYEVTWLCSPAGCSTELVTIARVHRGWVMDTNGYVFKADRPLWTRRALHAPPVPRQPNGPVRADDDVPEVIEVAR